MSEDILDRLLEGHEWKDLELKESGFQIPASVYESVSAFQNTEGGHVVLGVDDKKKVIGVTNVDKQQGDFLGELNNTDKFSSPVACKEYLVNVDGNDVLIFYIPEAHRKDKPIYVRLKKGGLVAFIRKGGGDYRCGKADLDRMINDAKKIRPDSELLDIDPSDCLDANSIKWYRHRYENKGGNRSLDEFDDYDFLVELGLLVESKGSLYPTLAAVLLLGKSSRIRQILPRPIVDCMGYNFDRDHANTGERWNKRITCEVNIVSSWQMIAEWYNGFSDNPFNLDQTTGQRNDAPPDYVAFREAVINLLSHQDFTDHSRWPVIENYADATRFWNPGDAFSTNDKLLEPGNKEVRNPTIVRALRDIGFSEQSGWGLREVFRNWSDLGRVPPLLNNDKSEKCFELSLQRKVLMSEEQVLFQAQIGISLNPTEAKAFANLCATDDAQITDSALRAALGLNGVETNKVIKKLIIQGVAINLTDHLIGLAEHLIPFRNELFRLEREKDDDVSSTTGGLSIEQASLNSSSLSTEQASPNRPSLSTEQAKPLKELTDKHKALLKYCDVPRSMAELQKHLDLKSRGFLKESYLTPMIAHGFMAMTVPDKPSSPKQRYIITEQGLALKEALK